MRSRLSARIRTISVTIIHTVAPWVHMRKGLERAVLSARCGSFPCAIGSILQHGTAEEIAFGQPHVFIGPELVAIQYSSSLWGAKPRGPRKMHTVIPRVQLVITEAWSNRWAEMHHDRELGEIGSSGLHECQRCWRRW
eukprot:316757-Amphidinium_carterae.1